MNNETLLTIKTTVRAIDSSFEVINELLNSTNNLQNNLSIIQSELKDLINKGQYGRINNGKSI